MLPARSASGMKTSGGTDPEFRVLPSQQRLEPDDSSREQVDERLIVDVELGQVGADDRFPDEQMAHHLRPLVGVKERDRRARLLVVLGAVHRGVGMGEQLTGRLRRLADDDADACGHREAVVADRERNLECPEQTLGERLAVLRRHPGADDRKLVATETHDEILLADGLDQSLRRAAEHLVADDVAVVVVDELEVIEVEHGNGDRPLAPVGQGPR